MISNTSRFAIAKDVKEWITSTGILPWGDIAGSDESTWKYNYTGDAKLLAYMNIYSSEIEAFAKYYPNMDILLQNIHWDWLFASAKTMIIEILATIKAGKSLVIIHANPLELVIIWELFKSQGIVDVVYNFNRMPAINSISKTLEAGLFLVSWEHLPWLKEKIAQLAIDVRLTSDTDLLKNSIILLDENDTVPDWDISRVDPYVKSAIGWKENIVIYRVDELPQKTTLLEYGIKDIYFFDTDTSTTIDSYYQAQLGDIFSFQSHTITSSTSHSIWYYEDYVIAQNQEYLIYKKEIFSKNTALRSTMLQGGGNEKWTQKKSSNSGSKNLGTPIPLKESLAYLGWLAIILPLFLLVEARGGSSVFVKNGTGGWNYNGGSSIRSSGTSWGWAFTHSSSSSTNSSISSFGGGGFSKWGG